MPPIVNAIRVIGDVTRDLLGRNEKDGWRTYSDSNGGAFFVAEIVRKAMSDYGVHVLAYRTPSAPERSRMLCAKWALDIFHYSAEATLKHTDVFRCIDRPRSINIIEPPTAIGGAAYEPSVESPKKPSQILIVEDLNIEGVDIGPSTILSRQSQDGRLEWESPLEANATLHGGADRYATGFFPTIIAMINRKLPNFDTGLWEDLSKKHNERTLAIIYADVLRWEGFNISKQISWERTAQDYLAELYTDFKMKPLGWFQHLIVRFGVTGAIHSYRIDKYRRAHRLYFDPTAGQHGIYRDSAREGDLIGNNSIYVSSILETLVSYLNQNETNRFNQYGLAGQIGAGIKKAICRCQHHFREGYGANEGHVKQLMEENGGLQEKVFRSKEWETEALRIADVSIPVGGLSWSILDQSAEYNLLNVAQEIVLKGVEIALNQPGNHNVPVWAPVVEFGDKDAAKSLVVVDRREVESYRNVHNLMREAISSPKDRAIAIAVFGPPGSGKSYSIKRLATSLSPDLGVVVLQRNVAEFTSYQDLKNLLDDVDKVDGRGHPVVFLDEFDCSLDGQALGWLKYFLPFMEKPTSESLLARSEGQREKKGNPIFVFAGGTSYTYHDFTRDDPSVGEQERLKFIDAKGPDFVSRLRGHINVLGPDPVDEYDRSYVIRRALWLRSILIDRIGRGPAEDIGRWFHTDVIRAMLKVSSYKHGTRSMRSIINMCVKLGGEEGRYVSTSLPTVPQLNMHVDGKELIDRINESRKELEMMNLERRKVSASRHIVS